VFIDDIKLSPWTTKKEYFRARVKIRGIPVFGPPKILGKKAY
jgi:hypothetical protein